MFVKAALFIAVAAGVGCATVTPVTPAPLSPAEAPKMLAALQGSCHVTGTQKPGGEVKEAKGIHWIFATGGKLHQHVESPLGTVDNDYTFTVDGRNITTDGTYKNIRVDDYSGPTLKLFLYDITETYYCTKE